jgi:hypothetical protein
MISTKHVLAGKRRFKKAVKDQRARQVSVDSIESGSESQRADTRPVAVLSKALEPPRLSTSNCDAVLEFERRFNDYQRKVTELSSQGVQATPASLKSCLDVGVLHYLARFVLEKDVGIVTDDDLKECLFSRASAMSESEKTVFARHLEDRIKMNIGLGSTVAAAVDMFEKLVTELDGDFATILPERRVCEIVRRALRPRVLREAVERKVSDSPDWDGAADDVNKLQKLVMAEAGDCDLAHEWQRQEWLLNSGKRGREEWEHSSGTSLLAQEERPGVRNPMQGSSSCFKCGRTGHKARFCRSGSERGRGRGIRSSILTRHPPRDDKRPKPMENMRSMRPGIVMTGEGSGPKSINSSRPVHMGAPRDSQVSSMHSGGAATRGVALRDSQVSPMHGGGAARGAAPFRTVVMGSRETKTDGGGARGRLGANRVGAENPAPRMVCFGETFKAPFIFDSGADKSVVPSSIVEAALGAGAVLTEERYDPVHKLVLANGDEVVVKSKVCTHLLIETASGCVQIRDVWLDVMPGGGTEILIGAPEWKALGIPLPEEFLFGGIGNREVEEDVPEGSVVGRRCHRIAMMEEGDESVEADEDYVFGGGDVPLLSKLSGELGTKQEVDLMIRRALENGAPSDFIEGVRGLVVEGTGRCVFRSELGKDGPANVQPMDIQLKDGVSLPRPPALRRYGPEQKQELATQVASMLECGLIRRATGGNVVSAVTMVRKKGGMGWRMCVDHRKINSLTVPDPWVFPRLDETLNLVVGAKCFGTFDLLKGYWQVPLTEKASKMLSFATPDGVFEPLRVPMGARNAACHFQKTMMEILMNEGLLNRGVLCYMDDVLLYADSPQELLELWKRVVCALQRVGLFITPGKSVFFAKRIVWCGHLISENGVDADPARIKALNAIPVPETIAQLQQFVAAANWLRDKIPEYARVFAPLQSALNLGLARCSRRTKAEATGVKVSTVVPHEEFARSFELAKLALERAVCLSHPKDEWEYHLFTDASDMCWGAVLTQVPPGWSLKCGVPVGEWPHEPLAFLSGSFSGSKLVWSTVDKEGFAIISSCSRLEHLLQRELGFHIWTDHRNLTYIFDPAGRPEGTSRATCSRLDRWGILLRDFSYIIQHVSGEVNVWADLLSRWGAGAGQELRRARAARLVIPSRRGVVVFQEDDDTSSADGGLWPSEAEICQVQAAAVPPQAQSGEALSFEIVPGVSLSRMEGGLWVNGDGKVWIPAQDGESDLRTRLMVIAHSGTSGHRGREVALRAIQDKFWWPGLPQDVRKFVSDCLQCLKVKGGDSIPRPMGHQLVGDAPNKVLHFDFLTMPSDDHGMKYVLVLKDDFSHHLELVACGEATASATAKCLISYFSRYGVVQTWITDQGPHFRNAVIEDVRRILKVEHHFVTPLSPWANGSVERTNRDLLKVLRALLSENRMRAEEWVCMLPIVMLVLNSTPTIRLGGCSPIEVLTGGRPVQPLDGVIGGVGAVITDDGAMREISVSNRVREYMEELRGTLAQIHKRVERSRDKRREENERGRGNANAVHAGLEVGDFVLVAVPRRNKLSIAWKGPMRVTKALSPWVFEVEDLVSGRRNVRHSRLLQKYSDSKLAVTEDLRTQLAHDDQEYFQVESLVGWRRVGRAVEFNVKWLGFDEPSWEPLEQLARDVPQIVRDFVEGYRGRGADYLTRAWRALGAV